VVKKLETCLSPSSAFNLFICFNDGTLKIINRRVFPLGVMYHRFPLTHEVIHGELSISRFVATKVQDLSAQQKRIKKSISVFDFIGYILLIILYSRVA
jgi:hypothetical protein